MAQVARGPRIITLGIYKSSDPLHPRPLLSPCGPGAPGSVVLSEAPLLRLACTVAIHTSPYLSLSISLSSFNVPLARHGTFFLDKDVAAIFMHKEMHVNRAVLILQ